MKGSFRLYNTYVLHAPIFVLTYSISKIPFSMIGSSNIDNV